MVAVATRAGLAARRDAIDIVHGLGATDGYIAGRFAARATLLAAAGAVFGSLAALPVLLGLAALAGPFTGAPGGSSLPSLPVPLWLSLLPALPPCRRCHRLGHRPGHRAPLAAAASLTCSGCCAPWPCCSR